MTSRAGCMYMASSALPGSPQLRHHPLAAPRPPRCRAHGGTLQPYIDSPFQHSHSWRGFRQCLLLAGAALAAAPALLLLDIGEQALLGMQHLWAVMPQPRQLQRHPQHDSSSLSHSQAGGTHVRRLLPLWPPVLPIALAVAPAGLLLLECGQACLKPVLIAGASLLLQAYINLQLVVLARSKGSSNATSAAPPAWVAAAPAHPTGQPATAAAAQGAPVQSCSSAGVAVQLFSWLQVAGDAVRCACCCYIAWVAAQAGSHGHADQAASMLWGAVQQCTHAASLAHVVAATSAAAAAMQQLARVWLPGVCATALGLASAGVYGASLLARCSSRRW